MNEGQESVRDVINRRKRFSVSSASTLSMYVFWTPVVIPEVTNYIKAGKTDSDRSDCRKTSTILTDAHKVHKAYLRRLFR